VQSDEIQHTVRRGREPRCVCVRACVCVYVYVCVWGGGLNVSVSNSVPDIYVSVQQTNQTEPITLQACTPSRSTSQPVPVPLTAVQPLSIHTAAPHHIITRGTVQPDDKLSVETLCEPANTAVSFPVQFVPFA
jgi:hypothetical protein